MDLRLDSPPWPPDDFQGCAPCLVYTSGLENRSSQLGNESNETYKEDQPGIQRVGGAPSQVVFVTPTDVSNSNIW